MRTLTLLILGLSLTIVTTVHAQTSQRNAGNEAEIAFSDSALQARFLTNGDRVGVNEGRLNLGVLLSEERDVVLSGAILVPMDFDLGNRLQMSLGTQVYAALLEEENSDVFAVSVGAEARYILSRNRQLAAVASAYWSPDIITFGSADNLTDLAARVEMRVTSSVVGFAGYRWFELDLLDQQERELQEEFFAGVRWRFE